MSLKDCQVYQDTCSRCAATWFVISRCLVQITIPPYAALSFVSCRIVRSGHTELDFNQSRKSFEAASGIVNGARADQYLTHFQSNTSWRSVQRPQIHCASREAYNDFV
jgi:hypothetical protein